MKTCRASLGSDYCELGRGHEGEHETRWGGGVVVKWRDDDGPYAHPDNPGGTP